MQLRRGLESLVEPSQIRRRCLYLHAELRRLLADAHELAERVLAGDKSALWRLREVTLALDQKAQEHAEIEAAELGPVLAHIDAWGEPRRQELQRTHANELHQGRAAVEATEVADAGRLAEAVRDAAEKILALLQKEEGELLHPDVLRDDNISIEQTDG